MNVKLLKNSLLVFFSVVALCCFLLLAGGGIVAEADGYDFYVIPGAALRMAKLNGEPDYGLRFIVLYSGDDYDSLSADDKLGAMIVPESYVTDFNGQDTYTDYIQYFENVKGVNRSKYLRMENKGSDRIATTGDYKEIRIALTGIQFNNVNRNFVAIGIIYRADTDRFYYSAVSDARSIAYVAEKADEAGEGRDDSTVQDYLYQVEKWSAYHELGIRYDANNDSGVNNYHFYGETDYCANLDAIDLNVDGFNAIPILYNGSESGAYLRKNSTKINIVKTKAKETDAYYNDGKDVYAVTDTAGSRDGLEYNLEINGTDSLPADGIKKITFKMYVTEEFYTENVYIYYQQSKLKNLTSASIGSYSNIKLLDENGNLISEFAHGQSGWLTVEVKCQSDSGLSTLFALGYGSNYRNRNKTLYISEVQFSTAAMTK